MINICIIFNDGGYTIKSFDGTLAQAQEYYLNLKYPVDCDGFAIKVDAVTEIKE